MKAIMISIPPKWVEKIASGDMKMFSVKTVPKCGTPFKLYMYCTKAMNKDDELFKGACSIDPTLCNGKVVGEFVCNQVQKVESIFYSLRTGRKKVFYDLHISDLKIYDKPKELWNFGYPCDGDCDCCKYERIEEDRIDCCRMVERAPQSWCYVEEL